jgi:hypothetical protein
MTLETFEIICIASIIICSGFTVGMIAAITVIDVVDRVCDWVRG